MLDDKNDNNDKDVAAQEQRLVFPFADLRWLFVPVGALVAGLVLFALYIEVPIGRLIMPIVLIFGFYSYASQFAQKTVLVVCPTYIKIFSGATIMADKISRAEFAGNIASVFYTGSFDEELEGDVAFSNIAKASRPEAKAALRAWLATHNIPTTEK